MKTKTFLLFSFFAIVTVNAQNSSIQQINLLKDLVIVTENKYLFKETNLITYNDNSLQVMITAESNKDYISRDKFLQTVEAISFITFMSTFSEKNLSKMNIKEIENPIGEPDIVFKILMTKDGLQLQTITEKGLEKVTMSWDEIQ